MRADLRDALSALADGEVADPQLVAEALLEPDAATLIITLAEARATLRDTTSQPSPSFTVRVEQALPAKSRSALVVFKRVTPALYAGLGLTAGILVGVLMAPAGPPTLPAIVTRTAIPAIALAPPSAVPPAPGPATWSAGLVKVTPPPARNVYRFEVGRNWREGGRP